MQISRNKIVRPPIVVVMGHIDHGKTTLLDAIRKTNVVAKESGGITQHIGAYEVVHGQKHITFLDTPGHEAFSKMRSRGAHVADIAILVIAADDGIKPQTREAIKAIHEANIPFLIAINKIDKSTSDIERIKNELANESIYIEGRGGTIPAVEISAKENRGIDQLLETVLLLAELEDLSCDSKTFGQGVIIEAHRDPKRGIAATLLVRNGSIKLGEYIVAGKALAKIRIFEDFLGSMISQAFASSPVVIVGFDSLPEIGISFQSYFSQKEALNAQRSAKNEPSKKTIIAQPEESETEKITIGIIIKADTEGSCEAIRHEVEKLAANANDILQIKFLRVEAGDVSLDDISLATSASHAATIAFRVAVKSDAKEFAERSGSVIVACDVIYDITRFLKEKIEALLPPQVTRVASGKARIVKIFKEELKTQIIGGKVIEGSVRVKNKFSLMRRGSKIGEGVIENLQSGKISAQEVTYPNDFGALIRSSIHVSPEDAFEIFDEHIIPRKL